MPNRKRLTGRGGERGVGEAGVDMRVRKNEWGSVGRRVRESEEKRERGKEVKKKWGMKIKGEMGDGMTR